MNDDDRCGATTHQGGEPCKMRKGWGTDHVGIGRCKLHGGSTPDHVKHANGQKAKAAVVTFGLPREIDPQAALLEEVHRCAGYVGYLAEKVRSFESDADLVHVSVMAGEKPSVWVELLDRERKNLVRVCSACISAGIAERQVRIAETMGQQLASAIRDVLEDFVAALIARGVPVDVLQSVQREMLPSIVRRRLSAIMEVGA